MLSKVELRLLSKLSSKAYSKIIFDYYTIDLKSFRKILATCLHLQEIVFYECIIKFPSFDEYMRTEYSKKLNKLQKIVGDNQRKVVTQKQSKLTRISLIYTSMITPHNQGYAEINSDFMIMVALELSKFSSIKTSLKEIISGMSNINCIKTEIFMKENGFQGVQLK